MASRWLFRTVLAALVLGAAPTALVAQATPPPTGVERVTVAPGTRYAAGWLHRLIFGSKYRDLWSVPIEVPVLSLDTLKGLTPLKRGGFGQTRSLHLLDPYETRYVFRSVDKDPSQGLPDEFEGTLVDAVVQDLISAQHPYAALIVEPLLDAVGILHVRPHLAVMPDDPRLGPYREEFVGMLGTFEERPDEGPGDTPGFQGFEKIVNTENLFDRLEDTPEHRIDAPHYLAARLMDVYLGDRDRHTDQWRWARVDVHEDLSLWRPIPRDRDQAFIALDGALMSFARIYRPQFVSFGYDYPDLYGATYNGRQLDRRLLVDLERSAWDSVAQTLQGRLTDSVIEMAVGRMPAPAYAVNGAELIRALKHRRDRLPAMARDYYELFAQYVDIHATDDHEIAVVHRVHDDTVAVTLAERRRDDLDEDINAAKPVYYRRTFLRDETREIRIYLQGGDDRVVVRGTVGESITLRVIGGGDDDEFVDSAVVGGGETKTYFYDGRGDNTFLAGAGTSIDPSRPDPYPDEESFEPPPPPSAFDPPAQNWGAWWLPAFMAGFDPDLGFTIGGGAILRKWGFRRAPYAYRMDWRVGLVTARTQPIVFYSVHVPKLGGSGRIDGRLDVRVPGIGRTRFHGLGNESPEQEPTDGFFKVEQVEYAVEPSLDVRVAPSLRLAFGPFVKLVDTNDDPDMLPGSANLFGVGTFGEAGGQARITWDLRDRVAAPTRGLYLAAGGSVTPNVLDVDDTFGRLKGEARTYFSASTLPGRPTLALRAAGERVWGGFPFFEGAFIGGAETVRGFKEDRFVGDASVFGNAELRLFLTQLKLIFPGEFGVHGLFDIGRVFLDGESSDRWHAAGGGGLWFAPISAVNTVSLSVAASDERVAVYFRSGFLF